MPSAFSRRKVLAGASLFGGLSLLHALPCHIEPDPLREASTDSRTNSDQSSFETLKEVEAGVLRVGYAGAGPSSGVPVILLHGWPYDIHSFADVSPLRASAGYRVIVPYLRGYGTTHFLSEGAFRNGQPSALALGPADQFLLKPELAAPS